MRLAELNVQIGGKISNLEKALADANRAMESYARGTQQKLNTMNALLSNSAKKSSETAKTAAEEAAEATATALAKSEAALSKFGASLTSIGRSMSAAITLPLAGAAYESVKFATDFEAGMAKVEGAAGAGAVEVGNLKDQVLKLAQATGKMPDELAQGLYPIESLGFRGAEAMDILGRAAKLSASGLGQVDDIAATAKFAIKAYGEENLSVAQAMDTFAAAVREGGAAPDAMAGAIGRVLPEAARMGISFDKLTGSIAAMTRIGLSVPEAVTAMRATLLTLDHPSKRTVDALDEVGLSAKQVAEGMKHDLLGTLGELAKASERGGDSFAMMFPNVRAFTGVLALTGAQAGEVKQMMDRVTDSAGSAERMFAVTEKTLKYKLNVAMAELHVAGIKIGATLAPVVEGATGVIKGLASAFSEMSQPSQLVIVAIGAIAAGTGPMLMGIGSAIRGFKELKEVMLAMREISWASMLPGMLEAAPVLIPIAAVAAAVYGLYKLFESGATHADDQVQQEKKVAAAKIATKQASDHQVESLHGLMTAYEKISDKTRMTASDTTKLRDIFDAVAKINPDLITAYDNEGHALGLVEDAVDRVTAAYERNVEQAKIVAKSMAQIALGFKPGSGIAAMFGGGATNAGLYAQISDLEKQIVKEHQVSMGGFGSYTYKLTKQDLFDNAQKLKQIAELKSQTQAMKSQLATGLPVTSTSKSPIAISNGGGGGDDDALKKIIEQAKELRDKAYEARKEMYLLEHGDSDSAAAKLVYDVMHDKIAKVNKGLAENAVALMQQSEAAKKANTANETFNRLMAEQIKQLAVANAKSPIEKSDAENTPDKSLNWFQQKMLRAMRISKVMKDIRDKDVSDEIEASQKQWKAIESIQQRAVASMVEVKKQIDTFWMTSHEDQVKYMLSKSGPLPFEIQGAMIILARQQDAQNRAKADMERGIADATSVGQGFGEGEKKRQENVNEYQKSLAEIQAETKNVTSANREQVLSQELSVKYWALSTEQIQQLVDAMMKLEDTKAIEARMQQLAAKISDVFVKASQELFHHGFKPAFGSILTGFRQMLGDMVVEWAKAQLQMKFAAMMQGAGNQGGFLGVLGQVFGLGGGKGGSSGGGGGGTSTPFPIYGSPDGPVQSIHDSVAVGRSHVVQQHFHFYGDGKGGLNLTEKQIAAAGMRGAMRAMKSGVN